MKLVTENAKAQARLDAHGERELNAATRRRLAETVACPHCEAPVANACTNPAGNWISKPHAKRSELARKYV